MNRRLDKQRDLIVEHCYQCSRFMGRHVFRCKTTKELVSPYPDAPIPETCQLALLDGEEKEAKAVSVQQNPERLEWCPQHGYPLPCDKCRMSKGAKSVSPSVMPVPFSLRQKDFAEWQRQNFGGCTIEEMCLGMAEEVGEMAHWILKSKQGIRGATPEQAKEKIADAFADTLVFGLQAMTCIGMDAEEVFTKVAKEVLARNWKENPNGDGFSQHKV